ncbi:MAG: DEAD/DEAH box helicase [Candidatus Altarchaeum sp. CG_4_10_14_0_8_um_filter_32_851]|nr:MAG: DEAD/DEAH box helicase [Candidatus Altarchaeum sp. CG_4_10_14_0_8_um_filter_32_851]
MLPTGLGKTLIAVIVAVHRLNKFNGSKVLFLAPTKPLAVQHVETFRQILNLKDEEISIFTSATATNKRKDLWKNSRVILATPQTIDNEIMKKLNLEDVSFLVFDEAHKAVGNYAYSFIADEYVKKAKNPLIMGLSASPSSDIEKISEISKNLFIEAVEIRTENDADVKPYIKKVEEEWVKVELPPGFKEIRDNITLLLKFYLKQLKDMNYTDTISQINISKKDLLIIQEKIRNDILKGKGNFNASSLIAKIIKLHYAIELIETQGIWTLSKYIERLNLQKGRGIKELFSDERMKEICEKVRVLYESKTDHPKLDALLKILKENLCKEGLVGKKILLFTQYRDTAEKIYEILTNNNIKCEKFIGQASRDNDKGMTQKEQIATLERFRNNVFNVLIATSVAEEGLDIPKVDIVIFYEPIPSSIRLIQRRGRTGRMYEGKVIILMAKGTRDEGYYWSAISKEMAMKRYLTKFQISGKEGIEKEIQKRQGQQSILMYPNGEYPNGEYQNGEYPNEYNKDNKDNKEGEDKEGEDKEGDNTNKFQTENKTVKIYVDIRERNTEIFKILNKKANVEVKQLEVGDYILSENVCVERKTAGDFLQSIVDRRLLEQAGNLARNFEIPLMIIEGELNFSARGIHPNAIRGAIASLATDFKISIIPAKNEKETAEMLIAIARREQEEKKKDVALIGEKRAYTLNERQLLMAESLPNVSSVLAENLLNHFKTIKKIANASVKALMKVEGIGSKKAEEIFKVTHSEYKKER